MGTKKSKNTIKLLRIVHTDVRKNFGGLQQHLRVLNQATVASSGSVQIFMLSCDPALSSLRVEEEGDVTYINIPVRHGGYSDARQKLLPGRVGERGEVLLKWFSEPLVFALDVVEIVKTFVWGLRVIHLVQPNLVQNHYYYRRYGLVVSLAAWLLGKPLILSYHVGEDRYSKRDLKQSWIFAAVNKRAKTAVKRVILKGLKAEYTSLTSAGERSVYVCGNCTYVASYKEPGFDISRGCDKSKFVEGDREILSRLCEAAKQKRLVVQVGSFMPHKNQLITVLALNELRMCVKYQPVFKQMRLVLVGSESYPPYTRVVRRKIQELGLGESVLLLPVIESREAMKAFYTQLQENDAVLVLPSLDEGMPRVLFESGGYKMPGIFSDLDGMHDLISDGVNGLLLKDPLNPFELASKINQLMSNNALYDKIAEGAYANVNQFDVATYAQKYVSLYDRVLAQNKEIPRGIKPITAKVEPLWEVTSYEKT